MVRLSIHLLGPMRVTLDGQDITHFETEKARALLAYLAVEADRPHRRDFLAEMLWPERPEGSAGANLRHALTSLRRAIGDASVPPGAGPGAPSPLLLVTRQTIQFNSASDAWVDSAVFADLLRSARPTGHPSLESLEEAAGICRGPFLADVSLGDSAAFAEWQLVTREQLGRQALSVLHRLAEWCEQLGQWDRALQHAWRQVALEPCDEHAHRQIMRLLALTGQRIAALAQYEACRTVLEDEMGVEPEAETTQLWRLIRDGELAMPAWTREPAPAFQRQGVVPGGGDEVEPPVFVAREREMARLRTFLSQAMNGRSRVVFVTGGAGSGKTALLGEFARRALDAHPDLLVARGDCSAYSGVGDPYLPFRDIMSMLTGDVQAHRLAGWVGRDGARRLWSALPLAIPTLLARGPSLIGTVVAGDALLSRAATALPGRADWLDRIRSLTVRARAGSSEAGPGPSGMVDPEQSFLFGQYADVLCALSDQRPLVLVLDDIQWADDASIGLLFHLARRLAGAGQRILVICAYRPEEVAEHRAGERHPLDQVVHEVKRTFGDVWVDLDASDREEGRSFVDAFVDIDPNRLGEGFRAALYSRTEGHPLFTVELLREMQERGDLIRDPEAGGAWIEARALDWEVLPARVEAVIEERVARLSTELRDILIVASVEGETFTAQVVASVANRAERLLLRDLARLETLHHLVRAESEVRTGAQRTFRYRFSHILVQAYLYRRLSLAERRLLHGQIADAMARLYEGQHDQAAVQLAHHFYRADDHDRALHYTVLAAEHATRAYAREAAITLYSQAIELAQSVSKDAVSAAALHRERGLAYEARGEFEDARTDYETALRLGQATGEARVQWRALLDLAKLWTTRDYDQSRGLVDQALDLARRIGDPAVLAGSLNWVGNWWLNAEDLPAAIEHHLKALAIIEQLGDRDALAHTLDDLGLASQVSGDLTASVGYYDLSVALFRELGDRAGLATSLTGRGVACSGAFLASTLVSPAVQGDARRDLEEALGIARETDSPAAESWALWCLSLYHTGHGQLGQALDAVRSALDVASAIGHREWIVGSRAILGAVYVELLAPEEAQSQLQQALALADRLRSQHWTHYAAGVFAAACCLGVDSTCADDLAQAQACLERVVPPDAPMDTVHRRTCWARRAELALAQGDPTLALDIVDRLIASAPGIAPGRVITFLWKLKGEALVAMGHTEEAVSFLQVALENAQAAEERFILWRLHASLGRLYHALGRPSEAEAELSIARESIRELGDTVPSQELRDAFLDRAYRTIIA